MSKRKKKEKAGLQIYMCSFLLFIKDLHKRKLAKCYCKMNFNETILMSSCFIFQCICEYIHMRMVEVDSWLSKTTPRTLNTQTNISRMISMSLMKCTYTYDVCIYVHIVTYLWQDAEKFLVQSRSPFLQIFSIFGGFCQELFSISSYIDKFYVK